MKSPFLPLRLAVTALATVLVPAHFLHASLDSKAIGLEPVYPKLFPERTQVLTEQERTEALASLPGWQYRDGILYKIYQTPTFADAIALITRISYPIQHLDHHPEIRNIYGKVYVGFTTYDQGIKVTKTDIQAAHDVEAAAANYPRQAPAAGRRTENQKIEQEGTEETETRFALDLEHSTVLTSKAGEFEDWI